MVYPRFRHIQVSYNWLDNPSIPDGVFLLKHHDFDGPILVFLLKHHDFDGPILVKLIRSIPG